MEKDLALLHEKVDRLSEQVAALNAYAKTQQRRQRDIEELKDDLIPVINHMIKLSIDELAEIGTEFQVEDLLFLLKRILRNTHTFLALMDHLEAYMGMAEEAELLGKQVFATTVEELDRLEREGYFAFTRESWGILNQIVKEFSEEDVRALGDNIVTILKTIRNMTQPEVLALANNAVGAIQEKPSEGDSVTTLKLLRDLREPEVRQGMARLLNLVKALGHPSYESTNGN